MKLDGAKIKKKNPINRNGFFFSDEDYDFQISIGMEYLNTQVNQTVVLYEVDMENTNLNSVYQEGKFDDINFKTPVELNVLYNLEEPELKSYDTNKLRGYYVKMGKLNFTIYEKELEENNCDIKRGDYIGLQVTPEHMEYFIVTNDGRVNYDNKHTLYGTRPYYRSVTCTIVSDKSETSNL